jgi:hypothetical protein
MSICDGTLRPATDTALGGLESHATTAYTTDSARYYRIRLVLSGPSHLTRQSPDQPRHQRLRERCNQIVKLFT